MAGQKQQPETEQTPAPSPAPIKPVAPSPKGPAQMTVTQLVSSLVAKTVEDPKQMSSAVSDMVVWFESQSTDRDERKAKALELRKTLELLRSISEALYSEAIGVTMRAFQEL